MLATFFLLLLVGWVSADLSCNMISTQDECIGGPVRIGIDSMVTCAWCPQQNMCMQVSGCVSKPHQWGYRSPKLTDCQTALCNNLTAMVWGHYPCPTLGTIDTCIIFTLFVATIIASALVLYFVTGLLYAIGNLRHQPAKYRMVATLIIICSGLCALTIPSIVTITVLILISDSTVGLMICATMFHILLCIVIFAICCIVVGTTVPTTSRGGT